MSQREVSAYFRDVGIVLQSCPIQHVGVIANEIIHTLESDAALYVMGNGGSAATALHFTNDLSRVARYRQRIWRINCLNDNPSIITSIANDSGYENIFSAQLATRLEPQDLVVALSVSGNSENCVKALEYANSIGATTAALLGMDGGRMRAITSNAFLVDHSAYELVEDIHSIACHAIAQFLMGV